MEKLSLSKANSVIKKIRQEIQAYFKKNNLQYAIFGKSMGLDSSVIAGLLSNIPGVKPIGVIMPCKSNPNDEQIAKIVLDFYKIPYLTIDLTNNYKTLKNNVLSKKVKLNLLKIQKSYKDSKASKKLQNRLPFAKGGIKARLRMITLYNIAQVTQGVVIGTGNYSEWLTGFWFLHGDVGDYYPIIGLYKSTEVHSLARALKVPKESLNAIPSDGLQVTQKGTDEDQLGLPYDKLDQILQCIIANKNLKQTQKVTNLPKNEIKKVFLQFNNTQFKRKLPIIIKRKTLI